MYEEIQWSAWLEPFQSQLWFSIVGLINFIFIIIWWIDRKSPFGHYRQLDSGDAGFTLLGILMHCFCFIILSLSRKIGKTEGTVHCTPVEHCTAIEKCRLNVGTP